MDNLLKEKDWLTINDILLEMYDIEDILVYPQQILRIFRVLIPYTKGYFLVFDTRGNIDEQKSAFLEMSIKECETYVRTFYEKDYIKYTFDLSKHTITYRDTDIIEEEYRKKTEFYQMFLELNEIGGNMSHEMMYSHQRLSCCHGYSLCCGYSYEQRTDKTGSLGNSDQVYILKSNSGFVKGPVHDSVDVLKMMSRCYFRHYSAVVFKYIYL
mgnify:CR=1 FL=1